ncbi:triple QxxK/R motif-containing protein isoform X2 [Mobula hypostoma]|uniref:triple QxxK/R motif-containing protein isoform X2 n=1 Tax=Mobula hypostoma TaxID=723540 RepID=UPI002FC39A4A
MGRKDASTSKIPIDHYRKQIGKQDYKKTKSVLKATRLKAEAKKTAPGIRDDLEQRLSTIKEMIQQEDPDSFSVAQVLL